MFTFSFFIDLVNCAHHLQYAYIKKIEVMYHLIEPKCV